MKKNLFASGLHQKPACEESALSRTAWLTIYCHVHCGKQWGLDRPVSDWIINRIGAPSFSHRLSFYTIHGVSARAKWFDEQISSTLERWRTKRLKGQIWILGAGLDSRWAWVFDRYKDQLDAYLEFDFKTQHETKQRLIADSPWVETYNHVIQIAADLSRNPLDALPESQGEVLVLAEGLLDYFHAHEKRNLIRAIADRAPQAEVLLDAQNRWLQQRNNKLSERSTGTIELQYANAAYCPSSFYNELSDLKVQACHQMLPILLRKRYPWLTWVPMPRFIRDAYTLLRLSRSFSC